MESDGVVFGERGERKGRRKNWPLIGFAVAAGVLVIRTISTVVAFAWPSPECETASFSPPHTLCASSLDPGAIATVIGAYALVGIFVIRLCLVRWAGRLTAVDDSVLLPAPPPDMSPAMLSVLRTGRVDSEAFAAALADLIDRGLIALDPSDPPLEQPTIRVAADPGAPDRGSGRPLGSPEAALLADIRSAAGADGVLPGAVVSDGMGLRLYERFRANLGRAAGSTWFTANPISVRNTWIAPFGAIAAAVLAVEALAAETEGPNFSFTPVGWMLASVSLCLIFIAAGAYSLYVNRTKAGAYQLAMAIAYENTILREWGPGGADPRLAILQEWKRGGLFPGFGDVSRRFPWMRTPNQLPVWMLAFGFGDQDTFDWVCIDLDHLGLPGQAAGPRACISLSGFRWMAYFMGKGGTEPKRGTRRVAGARAGARPVAVGAAKEPLASTPTLAVGPPASAPLAFRYPDIDPDAAVPDRSPRR